MPTPTVRRHVMERNPKLSEREKKNQSQSPSPKRLQKFYPLGIPESSSTLSLSPLCLSQDSSDSSLNGSFSSWERKISLSFLGFLGSRDVMVDRVGKGGSECREFGSLERTEASFDGNACILRRCSWITKSTEEHYVSFHDECWGVPVYNDNSLFELLSLAGMLIDHNWSDIIRKRELYREVFAKFDPNDVAKMEEVDITELCSNKELMLAENRVRCIVENARCILKVSEEFGGSFGRYIWAQVNNRPIVSRHKKQRSVPMRTPKSEAISKDLVRRGFRLVGPVIVYSFMQAAGLAVDHLVGCFRFPHCVRLAARRPKPTIIPPRGSPT